MLVKFSKPQTPEQLAFWSRHAVAVIVCSLAAFLLSLVELGFSGSNLAMLIESKATFLGTYTKALAAVIGFGFTATFTFALWALCLAFYQTIFRNNDGDPTNDEPKPPLLIALYVVGICGLSVILVFTGMKGAETIATDKLAYKAQTVATTTIDSVFNVNTSQIRTDVDTEVKRLESAFGGREATITALYKSQKAELSATIKPWAALKAKLNTLETDYRAQLADNAAEKAKAIQQQLDLKNIAMAEANKEASTQRGVVHAKNSEELHKAKTSKESYVNALTYFSLYTVPSLLVLYAIIGYIMVRSGMFLQMDVPDEYAEGGTIAKFFMASKHFVGAYGHNAAAFIYNSAPNKKPMGLPAMIAPPPPPMPETKEHLPFFRSGGASDTPPPPANNSIDLQKALLQYRKHNADINSRKKRGTELAKSHIEKDTAAMSEIQNTLKASGYQIVLNDRKAFEVVKL